MSKESRRRNKRHSKNKASRDEWAGWTPTRMYDDGWERPIPVPELPPLDVPALMEAIRRNIDLDAFGLEMRDVPRTYGVGLYLGNKRIGEVEDDRAQVGRHLPMGDFMTDGGDHWDSLREHLAEALAPEPAVVLPPAIQSAHLAKAMPDSITDDVRELVRSASAVIRDRRRDYGMPHVLTTLAYRLTFWPIDEVDNIAGVPFTFAPVAGRAVDGRLCYRQAGDVVPIMVSSEVADKALLPAWVAATCDFGKLLTDPEHQPEDAPDAGPGASTGSRRLGVAGARIAGFKRHLPAGQHASPAARQRAAAIDVQLAPEGETWVSEHIRGKPSNEPVRIQWTPAVSPAQLGLQIHRAA